jgi:putative nucleotidyltransferase with HDIG domain
MSRTVENLRLGELYQGLVVPATAANDASDATTVSRRVFQWSISALPVRRDDGQAILYPFWGIFKIALSSFAHVEGERLRFAIGPLEAYALSLAAAAVAFGGALAAAGVNFGGPLWALALLGVVAVGAEQQPVRISANMEITVAFLPVLFAAVVYGPLAAMVVGAFGILGDFGRPHVRWLLWTSMRAISAGAAGSAALLILSSGDSFGRLTAAVFVAAITEALIDALLGSLIVAIRGTGSCLDFLNSVRPIILATIPLHTPVIVLLAYAYEEISAWSVLLFFGPAFAAQRLYMLYREQREAALQLKEVNSRLERANLSFASALVAALDARDQYTAGHSAAVAIYARDIASRLGLSEAEQQLAHLCGLVHDVGKVGLPAGLLEKPGALTLEERRRMEEHSAIGERILANVEDYGEIAKIVRHHHERVDGHGYPDGLTGPNIPTISKIIAVADAYDAMTSDRPYRDAMPSRVARLRLAQAVQTQFDTTVVAAFEAILAGATECYLSGIRAEFDTELRRHAALTPQAAPSAA